MIELLRRLVEAWGATRDPALEEPILRIGMSIAHERGGIFAKSKGTLETLWHELAANVDVGDVDRLLDAPWPQTWKTATLRVNVLARFAPDPRIAIKLMQIAMRYDSSGAKALHVAIADVVSKMATTAVRPSLEHFGAYGRRVGTSYYKVKEALARQTPKAADSALLAEANAAKPVLDVSTLFAQHVASPGDLALRAVLADALQASGDPRGEFIMLQLAIANGTADAAAQRRARQLLAAHIDRWTGLLPGVVRDARRFERGFLVAVRSTANGNDLANALDLPEWSTVEDFELANYADLAPLVRRMPLLRTLYVHSYEALDRLAKAGPFPSLRALGAADWLPTDRVAFPNLAVLGGVWVRSNTDERRAGEVARVGRALELKALVHMFPPVDRIASIARSRDQGPPEQRVLIVPQTSGFAGLGWRIRIFRDEPRALLAWAGTNNDFRLLYDAIVAELRAGGIESIENERSIDLAAP